MQLNSASRGFLQTGYEKWLWGSVISQEAVGGPAPSVTSDGSSYLSHSLTCLLSRKHLPTATSGSLSVPHLCLENAGSQVCPPRSSRSFLLLLPVLKSRFLTGELLLAPLKVETSVFSHTLNPHLSPSTVSCMSQMLKEFGKNKVPTGIFRLIIVIIAVNIIIFDFQLGLERISRKHLLASPVLR